jgi:cyanophycinase-like exopeptidase
MKMKELDRSECGSLVIIGGHEDRTAEGERRILKEVARLVGGGKLVLATVASHKPEGYFDEYAKAFADLGIGELVELYVEDRAEAHSPESSTAWTMPRASSFQAAISCASPARSATPRSRPRSGACGSAAASLPARRRARR